ncbi:hypothetical protein [Acinetobacter sp. CFCC 10889]|uniref:hypothetical protein n=1 Tax=Acinetobacter sp. CFCC 10889 TaxID=1775557 RepID=UPI000DD056B1|nr:hypothetical protein [Acinetobacter sp. CFCC 10889]
MNALSLHTFLYSAKLNGRTSRGEVQATNSTQAINMVKAMNELFSNVTVRTAKRGKSVKSCEVKT